MRTRFIITLPSNSVINISISYTNIFSENRDFLFELELPTSYNLDINNDIFIYTVDAIITFVQARNFKKTLIILSRRIRLDTVVKYSINGYYMILYKSTELTGYK